uniref:SRP54-type proteins GTP-binding domain-containing protein n=1 Tax=Parascaris equorum TaxID=6256 RepID=A0A914S4S4_PAREQ
RLEANIICRRGYSKAYARIERVAVNGRNKQSKLCHVMTIFSFSKLVSQTPKRIPMLGNTRNRTMIELFTIFGKGGLVLWCFQEGGQLFTDSINELIKEVLMQERGSSTLFKHNNVSIKYKLDNEFELVFLVVYQSAIQLSYGDQLISDVQKKFRDMYKNVLCDNKALYSSSPRTFDNFGEHFQKIYRSARSMNLNRPEKVMRKFEWENIKERLVESFMHRQLKTLNIMNTGGDSEKVTEVKKGKQARVWGLAAIGNKADIASLDYSKTDGENGVIPDVEEDRRFVEEQMQFVGRLKGELPGLDEEQSEDEASEEDLWLGGLAGSCRSAYRCSSSTLHPEPADKLCQSVAAKLEGKVVSSFRRVAGIVKESIREALVQFIAGFLARGHDDSSYLISHRVLIAAGDTFRAGAVEQLRTHTKHLNSLHPNSVQLYEQGYGKDPAGLAAAAIAIGAIRLPSGIARQHKLYKRSSIANVGAAISMTYITGQPIVFVGTGQTYKDLKNLNINAVVHSLLK